MSCSEEESTAASVLSQMSQMQQSPSDTVETQGMSVAHQCDVETSASANSSQDMVSVAIGQIMESCQTTRTSPNELEQRVHDTGTSTLTLPSDEEESKLQTIVEVSSVKVFPCEYCGKVFNKSYNLKTHHRVHTGERPFPCSVCGHGFANLGDLKRHARTHTGEKPFTCEFCNKAFSDFGSHKRHLRLHTGFKPFKCEQCDREFTRLDSYKNHTRLHTGERPYKCDECQKEFNYLTTYKRHLNIHSGERPYSCDLCEKRFTRLNYLKNHKLNHSKPERNTESKDSSGTNHEETTSSTVLDHSMISNVTINTPSDDSHGNNEDDVSDHVIHQVAQALSQGGMQVSVTTVMDNSGTGQPILIQTPVHGSGSDETTLILTQELLSQASTEGNQQFLGFTANSGNKETVFSKDHGSPEEGTETRQIFITQPLFKPSQDFSADEAITESQLIHPNFENIVTVTQEDGNIVVSEVNEQSMQNEDENQSDENTSEVHVTSEDSEVLTTSNIDQNAVYIAIDPTQTNVQQILGELQVAVNP